ncbi:MAG: GldG family protein [Planctomycetota bacterium]
MVEAPEANEKDQAKKPRTRSFGLVVHVFLVALLAIELITIGSAFRVRVDMTADGRFSLTAATERVLSRLEAPLVVEAYFSPDEDLGVRWSEKRRVLREVLDEFVQRGDGRVRVDVFDPSSDARVRAKAERLGIRPNPIQDFEGGAISRREVWQGVRLTYGGRLQRVIGFVPFTDHTAAYESLFTPLVAALVQGERPKIGVAFWTSGAPGEAGYQRMLALQAFTDRFEFVPLDFAVRDRIPADLDTVILLGPRRLSGVQKYALDQFLLRGGTLVCFLDGIDVATRNWPAMTSSPVSWDEDPVRDGLLAKQLLHYGVEVDGVNRALLDNGAGAVPLRVPIRRDAGGGQIRTEAQELRYPYWFRPTTADWSAQAAVLAQGLGGDEQLAADLARVLRPGVLPAIERLIVAPEVFWAIAVDPAPEIPAGLQVRTLMRTSPLQKVNQIGQSVAPSTNSNLVNGYRPWIQNVQRLTQQELATGRQSGLFVEVRGTFTSYFDGVPPARPEDVDSAIGSAGPTPVVDGRTRLTEGTAEGRLLVFGDSTFLRDDFAFGELTSLGMPARTLGHSFFLSLLDWLAGDDDLVELRDRRPVDRRQVYVDVGERSAFGLAKTAEVERDRVSTVRRINLVLPMIVLFAIGGAVVFVRRARGRRFVAAMNRRRSAS